MRYRIEFDVDRYVDGAGRDFLPVQAPLDGDWICERYRLPMDRFYTDYDYQQEARIGARAEVHQEIGLPLIREYGVNQGVITNASLFGGRVRYHDNATPVLEPVIREPAGVTHLARRIDDMSDEALLHAGELHSPRLEWLQRWEKKTGNPATGPASDGTKGLATVCGQLCTVTDFLTWLYTDPEQMAELTALVGRTFERYIAASREYDGTLETDGLAFASDVSGLMSPQTYRHFCAPHEKALYDRFAPTGKRYYHADSNMKNHVPALSEIGVNTVNIGPMVRTADILLAAPDMVVHGQVPPTQILWQGTPDQVVDAVRCDVRDVMAAGGQAAQLVVTTAGSINPGTPVANLQALFWAAMEYAKIDKMGKLADPRADELIDFDRGSVVMQIS